MDFLAKIIDIIDSTFNIEIIDSCLTLEYKDLKFTHILNSLDIEIIVNDCYSYHILRLIVNKLNVNEDIWIKPIVTLPNKLLLDYFIILKKTVISNYYDYCTICGNKHENLGMNYISSCNDTECKTKIYHYPINNKITDFYKTDPTTLMLLLKTFLSAFNHPHFEKIVVSPIIYPICDIKIIKNLIPEDFLLNKIEDTFSQIAESYDDFYLWKKLDDNFIYALLNNSISNNYYSMYSYRDLVNPDLKKKILLNFEQSKEELNIEYYNVNYTSEIENKIKSQLDDKMKYYYLYHGSPFHCWNSIIKNGLKVMSGTQFMTTGAAYGNGIYASNQLSISYGYSRINPPFNYSMIGLFQVIENPEKYQKTTGIYVIPDEKILILRTLIKINKLPTNNHTIFKQLDDYFIRQRTVDKSISDKNLITLKNKRLTAEIKLIEKIPDKVKIKSCSDETDKPWLIELFVKDKIYQMEMSFHNYPLNPPYFKMVNFEESIKGIIDKEFKINLPILSPGVWTISNKIIEVLEIIWNFFNSTY